MLTLKSLLTLGAIAVLSASAAPAPEASPSPGDSTDVVVAEPVLKARQAGGCAKLCADHYFQGQCLTFCTNHNQCASLTGVLNDWVSSIQVTSWPTWGCTFYEHANCQGASLTTSYDETLHDGDGWWADRISSMRCYQRCDSTNPFCN